MNAQPNGERLHALDAVRSFALLLGVAFHAMLSFIPGMPPGLWAMNDNSPSPFLGDASFVAHSFRMTLFFFIAGYFARVLHQRVGCRFIVASEFVGDEKRQQREEIEQEFHGSAYSYLKFTSIYTCNQSCGSKRKEAELMQ